MPKSIDPLTPKTFNVKESGAIFLKLRVEGQPTPMKIMMRGFDNSWGLAIYYSFS